MDWRWRWRWRRSPLSGGQISLLISPPEEEQRVAAAPRRKLGKRLLFWGFLVAGINRSLGRAPEEGGGAQAARGRGPTPGRARVAPGAPRSPLWSHFWLLAPSGAWIFRYFSGNFLERLKIHFPAHNKTIQAALLKTALVRVSFVRIMQE